MTESKNPQSAPDELLPCPFCGGNDLRFAFIGRETNPPGVPDDHYTFSQHVECRGCGVSTGRARRVCSPNKDAAQRRAHLEARQLWNRRAAPVQPAGKTLPYDDLQRICDEMLAALEALLAADDRPHAGNSEAAIRAAAAIAKAKGGAV